MGSRKIYLSRNIEDVEAYYPDDNDSLVWVAASGFWMPVAVSGGEAGVTDFLDLTDTPPSYATFSGYFVQVKDTEDGLEFASAVGGVTTFLGLTDVPDNYTDDGEKFVKVNVGEDALEFVTETIPADLTDLSDTPADYTDASGLYLKVKDTEDGVEFSAVEEGGASAFTDLSDVPNSYSGQAGKHTLVNEAEDALEFVTISGGAWAFEDSTESLGIDQDRDTGGSFAYQQQDVWIARPILLTSVLWDIRIADNYTLTVRDAAETVLATKYVASVGAASEDREFALDYDLLLDPGFYKFRMTPDSAQLWSDVDGDVDYYFNPFSIVYAIDYGGTEYTAYRAPFKLKFYDSYTIQGESANPWTPYHDESILAGWSAYTKKLIYYKEVGSLVFVKYDIQGTSDATNAYFRLPYANNEDIMVYFKPARSQDNGVWGDGSAYGRMSVGNRIALFFTAEDASTTSWTASGDKSIIGEFWYERY